MKKVIERKKCLLIFLLLVAALSFLYSQDNAGDVWLLPQYGIINPGKTIVVSLHINTGTQALGSFECTLNFSSAIVVDTTKGVNGIAAGPDSLASFSSVGSADSLTITGFDAAGKNPGVNLNVALIYLKAQAVGTVNLDLTIGKLIDPASQNIGTTQTVVNKSLRIMDSSFIYGDVNGDGIVNIVDALQIAQYTPGMLCCPIPAQADANGDGNYNIVDALIVAQYSVGLIPVLPAAAGLTQEGVELVPVYPAGIAPVQVNPYNGNISVLLRNSSGAPVAGKTIKFAGSLMLSSSSAVTDSNGIATVQAPVPADAGINANYTLTASAAGEFAMTPAICQVLVNVVSAGMPTPAATPSVAPTRTATSNMIKVYLAASAVTVSTFTNSNGVHAIVSVMPGTSCTIIEMPYTASRAGNMFSADIISEEVAGMWCVAMVPDPRSFTYDLGILSPGTYTFNVSNWGNLLVSHTFTLQ